jgi:hypothetical protein
MDLNALLANPVLSTLRLKMSALWDRPPTLFSAPAWLVFLAMVSIVARAARARQIPSLSTHVAPAAQVILCSAAATRDSTVPYPH